MRISAFLEYVSHFECIESSIKKSRTTDDSDEETPSKKARTTPRPARKKMLKISPGASSCQTFNYMAEFSPVSPTLEMAKDRGTRQAISGRRVIPKTISGSQSGEPKTKSTMITSEDEAEDDEIVRVPATRSTRTLRARQALAEVDEDNFSGQANYQLALALQADVGSVSGRLRHRRLSKIATGSRTSKTYRWEEWNRGRQ